MFDAGSHFVVVECDKHQHRSKEVYDCENVRMWQIVQSLGLSAVFIRYNPDAFKDHTGKKTFFHDTDREAVLVSRVRILLDMGPSQHFLSVMYLYYNGRAGDEAATLESIPHPKGLDTT